MNAVADFEREAGKSASMVQFFQPFAQCGGSGCSFYSFPTEPMDNIRSHGSIPVLSWSSQAIPSTLDQPDFQLSDVISGRYDDYIAKFASAARDWGHPFFLRFNWEMNGNWFPWSEGVNGNGGRRVRRRLAPRPRHLRRRRREQRLLGLVPVRRSRQHPPRPRFALPR